jgi:hypothetical protein
LFFWKIELYHVAEILNMMGCILKANLIFRVAYPLLP